MARPTASATPKQRLLARSLSILRAMSAHYPLTALGSSVLLLSAAALRLYGYAAMDLVVFALCLCAFIIVIGSLFATLIAGYFVQRSVLAGLRPPHASEPLRLESGFFSDTGLALPALRWLPLVRLKWSIVDPSECETALSLSRDGTLQERCRPAARALGASIVRRFEVGDVLGLCRYRWRAETPTPYRILPSLGRLRPLTLQRARITEDGLPDLQGEPEGDRMETRPYAPGDPVRDILWKGFARNRELTVRLPERSVALDDRTFAYLLAGEGDEPAAALARMALQKRLLGDDWTFCADGSDATRSLEAALDAIAHSARQEPGAQFAEFLRSYAPSHCLVFAAATDPSVAARIAAAVAATGTRTSVVLGVDLVPPPEPRPWWQRALLRPPARASLPLSVERLTPLGQCVESLVVIDRVSGQRIEDNYRGGLAREH